MDEFITTTSGNDVTEFITSEGAADPPSIYGGSDSVVDYIEVVGGSLLGDLNHTLGDSGVVGTDTNWVLGGSSDPYYKHVTDHKLNPDVIGECSIVVGKPDVCGDRETYELMNQLAPDYKADVETDAGRRRLIDLVKSRLHLGDERAIIASKQFIDIAGSRKSVEKLSRYYKVPGPTDVGLLSNVNIDLTLRQWARKFPKFFPYNFNMVNFKETGDTLATIPISDVFTQGYDTAACVINSDVYKNPGKHWMALFVDMRQEPFTVEFFNSSGNPPVAEYTSWMQESVTRLESLEKKATAVCVSRVKHQYSRTECGVYALWYIWCRLNGRPYSDFAGEPIPDTDMFRFRQHLFWDRRRPGVKKFDLGAFEESTDTKWE